MIEAKNKINAFQFSVIGFFLGSALFQGVGELFLYESSSHSAWITTIITAIIGVIPILLINYISNYEPDKNIINKVEHLFGKFIGSIVNIFITLIILMLTIITLWLLLNFAEIKYLTGTPPLFVGVLFMIPIVYTTYKGIETIARSTEILFFITIAFVIIITLSLIPSVRLENLFPILHQGVTPIFKSTIQFLSYIIPLFILLTIIPKNNIKDKEKANKFLLFGYLTSILTLAVVTFMITTIIGADLANIYRFPSYYVMKRIEIIGFIENAENIFSLHWVFNMYVTLCMGLYYLSTYVQKIFKTKKNNIVVLSILAIVILKIRDYFFYSSVVTLYLIKKFYTLIIGGGAIMIIIIVAGAIKIKSLKKP